MKRLKLAWDFAWGEGVKLRKIISGGQTGADQAGLRAARKLGLETGGHAPKGWETHTGTALWLAEYGIVESAGGYAARTAMNVRDSDGTVRLAVNFTTAGEMCTLKAIKKYGKPHFDANPFTDGVAEFRAWLVEHKIGVLNVAGNSERNAKGIGEAAEAWLMRALCDER